MEVILAEHAGACYGVQRALDIANEVLAQDMRAYTLGPLIHNPQVVSSLAQLGAQAVQDVEQIQGGTVIIRSHGVTPQEKKRLEETADRVVDATCPHVARAQRAAAELARGGCRLIVVGEPGHPEVTALREYARCEGAKVDVVSKGDILLDDIYAPVGVVVQTTQRKEVLDDIVAQLESRGIKPVVKNTICSATTERQASAESLAQTVDAMVVIGGKNSSNTTRLAEICSAICPKTFHVESAAELDGADFRGCSRVGVTAGASTPEDQISDVVRVLEDMDPSPEI